jgi:sugar transferase (PEP-CTERM/EpsH1 system associated)
MREVLFLCHRVPFPPDRGDKIRSNHILNAIARLAPVHVATFSDDPSEAAEESELARVAKSYRLVRRAKPLVLAGLQALAQRRPVSLTAFHDRALAAYVEEVLATRPISAIYVFSGQMGQYVPASYTGTVIADFVDVDSAKFEAYAQQKGITGWIDAREARLLRAEEARLAARADASLLISRAEADLFAGRLPAAVRTKANVRVVPNGIDSASFDRMLVDREPRMRGIIGPRLIFAGQMDYAPNIAAATRAIDRILPLIRRRCPEATFHVVGRNPPAPLLARHGADGCYVWGRVDDIRPWLKAADLALIPLEIARGVQNKVLEAMAMALPVVTSSGAATGIDADDGVQFAVADSDDALADKALALLADRNGARAMGAAARRFVIDHAGWQSALAELPALLNPARAEATARDAA